MNQAQIYTLPTCNVYTETEFFRPVATQYVPKRTKRISVATIFAGIPRIRVCDGFETFFDVDAMVEAAPEKPYVALEIKEQVKDVALYKASDRVDLEVVRRALPKVHILSPLQDIAGLIAVQKNGEHGFLLVNGLANVFFAKGKSGQEVAVRVCWLERFSHWLVLSWSFDMISSWGAGRQIICPGYTPCMCIALMLQS